MPTPNQTTAALSAVTSTAAYTKLLTTSGSPDSPTGSRDMQTQVARVAGIFSTAAATATVRIVKRGAKSTAPILDQILLSAAASAHRQSQDGTTDGYVATFDGDAKKCFVDLSSAGIGTDGDTVSWYVGVPTISGGTLTLSFDFMRAI